MLLRFLFCCRPNKLFLLFERLNEEADETLADLIMLFFDEAWELPAVLWILY